MQKEEIRTYCTKRAGWPGGVASKRGPSYANLIVLCVGGHRMHENRAFVRFATASHRTMCKMVMSCSECGKVLGTGMTCRTGLETLSVEVRGEIRMP